MNKHYFTSNLDISDVGGVQPNEPVTSLVPEPDYVITRDKNGDPASLYKDDIWDFSAYQNINNKSTISFTSWDKGKESESKNNIIKEMKWLSFALLYISNKLISGRTFFGYFKKIRKLASFSLRNNIGIYECLSDEFMFAKYVNEGGLNTHDMGLINSLYAIDPEYTEAVGIKLIDFRKYRVDRYDSKQHPVIPTQIYDKLITNQIGVLEDFLRNESRLIDFLIFIRENRGAGYQIKSQKISLGIRVASIQPNFLECAMMFKLDEYFSKVSNLFDQEIESIQKFGRFMNTIQDIAKTVIHIFSGMRHNEARNLPFDCLEEFNTAGKKHYRIKGKTTKFGRKSARWVTSGQAVTAIQCAQVISRFLYEFAGLSKKQYKALPLFVSFSGVFLKHHANGTKPEEFRIPKLNCDPPKKLVPVVTVEDLEELRAIDPVRDWEADFPVGEHWKVTTHQFRRTLAVYASASGLVTLPSLRNQLQHITDEMTRYYSRGSAWAGMQIKASKGHMALEFQNAAPEAMILSVVANVLHRESKLFGAAGQIFERQFRETGVTNDTIEETKAKVKRGELVYKPTPLGGCTSMEPCDDRATGAVSACLTCAKAVIKQERLERVIKISEAQANRCAPESKEFELRQIEIRTLKEYAKEAS